VEEIKALVTRVRMGDQAAFEIIVRRFQDMAVGYGYARLGDIQLAEDAAQEAFINAYDDIGALRDPAAFPGWFRQIVFKHIDRLRRGKYAPVTPLEQAVDMVSQQPGPEEAMEKQEMQANVFKLIQTLPENEREVVALFYIGQYSQKEIGAFLDVPVSTVKMRLYTARTRLKERIITMVQDYLQANRPSNSDQFTQDVLNILAPNPVEHTEDIYRLLDVGEPEGTSQWRAGRMAHSHLDWATSRIGRIDDRTVTVLGVYDLTMRIASARVRVAGLNLDATDPSYQNLEDRLREKVILASIEAMRNQGYDLSLTFGNKAYFEKLGYTFAWRELAWLVKADDVPAEALSFSLHLFDPIYREDLAELYNRQNISLTGTAVRPTYLRNKHPNIFQGWFWTDAQNNPVGYISGGADIWFSIDQKFQSSLDQSKISKTLRRQFEAASKHGNIALDPKAVCVIQQAGQRWLIIDDDKKYLILKHEDRLNVYGREYSYLWVDELAGDPNEVLQVLGVLARQYQCEFLFFDRLHYKSAIGKRLRQLPSCKIIVGGERQSRSYMIRIINLQTLLQKLAPELSERLKQSCLDTWCGNLAISNGTETVTLAIDHANVQIVPMVESEHSICGGSEIVQLMIGTEDPLEVVELSNIQLSGDAARLIEILFPAQYPQMENQAL
jgi:RNA polymerase sigma factor (sigma-70 family)